MNIDVVTQAVREIRSRGDKVSVRSVHALTGGSFRDLSRLLKDAAEFLEDDEVAALDAEVIEPVAVPSLGKIVETFQASQLADAEAGRVGNELEARLAQLRLLAARRPLPAVDPADVSASVAARKEHDELMATLEEEAAQLDGIKKTLQAEGRAWRAEHSTLERQAQELRYAIPGLRRDVQDAKDRKALQERDARHAMTLATRDVASREWLLADAERRLQQLLGS